MEMIDDNCTLQGKHSQQGIYAGMGNGIDRKGGRHQITKSLEQARFAGNENGQQSGLYSLCKQH